MTGAGGQPRFCQSIQKSLGRIQLFTQAAAFGFESNDAYYLYNSAYAPDAARLSPGIVLVAALVRSAVRSGRRRLDFLKGDERYKFDLGAEPRPLYRVTAVLGG